MAFNAAALLCMAWFAGEKRRRAAALQDAGALFDDVRPYTGHRIFENAPVPVKKDLVLTIMFPGHKTVSGVVLCLSLAGLVGRLEMKVYWQKDEGVTGRPVGPPDWP